MNQLQRKFNPYRKKLKNLSTRLFKSRDLILSQTTPYDIVARYKYAQIRYYASPDKQYKEQSGEINAAHLNVPDFETFYSKWVAENTTPVSIYNGDSYEGTYILDNDSFGKFMDVVADTGFYKVYKDGEGQWRINNRGYGKELHDPLFEYVNKLKPTVQAAYNREVSTAQRALDIQKEGAMNALNTSYGAANQSLSQQRAQVGQLQSNYISNISNIRFKYQNKLKGMSSTVKGLFS